MASVPWPTCGRSWNTVSPQGSQSQPGSAGVDGITGRANCRRQDSDGTAKKSPLSFGKSVGIFNSLNKTKKALEVLIINGMSTSSINPLNNSYLQSILSSALQSAGVSSNSTSSTSSSQTTDSGQLSPFAQMLSTLQQLQQSNPTEYQQV